ncbi:IucA/IucC family C-terminal-domain containing protein [Metabacillus litoralis]|uniref:IucA/IucC family C-terminal-domain containing protein n=1 Tax=Metabacillus litoralis TaxID=152268 RepID=UPI001CFD00F5|nr:IucA/IucC family C-terminal-domain containing protein [Metabacillus litoralis]
MAKLSKQEIESLKKYRLSCEKAPQLLRISGQDFLTSDRFQELISSKEIQLKLNTTKHPVIGSMIMKRYAFLAALVLYAMSVFNKGINSSISNISLQTDEEDPIWLPSFYFDDLEVTIPEEDRDSWRSSVVETLFKYNIANVVSSIAKEAKISKTILWENTAIYIFWMYETLLQEAELEEETLKRIQDDFDFVVQKAPAELFGVKGNHPILPYYHQKQEETRKRSTCCLFYFTSKNGDRCKTCPIECKQPTIK